MLTSMPGLSTFAIDISVVRRFHNNKLSIVSNTYPLITNCNQSTQRKIIVKHIKNLFLLGALISSSNLLANPLPVTDSGLVTVLPGQTARLNVVNIGDPSTSCQMTLSFLDADGNTFSSPLLATLPGGGAVPLDAPVAGLAESLRVHIDYSPQLIAQATFKDPLVGCYNLIPTFEVLDVTGTRVIVTNFVGIPTNLQKSVSICHKPHSHAQQPLTIPLSALRGHMGHGDTLTPCP